MARVLLRIAVLTENRSDHWACRSPEFGFTVYGATRESAKSEVNKALTALLGSFHGDLEGIERFVKKRGVKHFSIVPDDQDTSAARDLLRTGYDGEPRVGQPHGPVETSLEEVLVA